MSGPSHPLQISASFYHVPLSSVKRKGAFYCVNSQIPRSRSRFSLIPIRTHAHTPVHPQTRVQGPERSASPKARKKSLRTPFQGFPQQTQKLKFPLVSPASPVPLRRESGEASRGGRRRNSHHRAVFGKAGNEAVMGISELARKEGFEPSRRFYPAYSLSRGAPSATWVLPRIGFCFKIWRREWDSNPRALARRRFSRPVPSTTRTSLHLEGAVSRTRELSYHIPPLLSTKFCVPFPKQAPQPAPVRYIRPASGVTPFSQSSSSTVTNQ